MSAGKLVSKLVDGGKKALTSSNVAKFLAGGLAGAGVASVASGVTEVEKAKATAAPVVVYTQTAPIDTSTAKGNLDWENIAALAMLSMGNNSDGDTSTRKTATEFDGVPWLVIAGIAAAVIIGIVLIRKRRK